MFVKDNFVSHLEGSNGQFGTHVMIGVQVNLKMDGRVYIGVDV